MLDRMQICQTEPKSYEEKAQDCCLANPVIMNSFYIFL